MHAHHLCDDFNRAFGTEAPTRPNIHSTPIRSPSFPSVSKQSSSCVQVLDSCVFTYRQRRAVQCRIACHGSQGRRKITYLADAWGVTSCFFSVGLCSQPWKILANWSWAG